VLQRFLWIHGIAYRITESLFVAPARRGRHRGRTDRMRRDSFSAFRAPQCPELSPTAPSSARGSTKSCQRMVTAPPSRTDATTWQGAGMPRKTSGGRGLPRDSFSAVVMVMVRTASRCGVLPVVALPMSICRCTTTASLPVENGQNDSEQPGQGKVSLRLRG
jgi:hypothetical protein